MKAYKHLTLKQRYIIQDLLELEKSQSFISRELGVHRSTISRELRRNTRTSRGRIYRAKGAQLRAEDQKWRPTHEASKIQGAIEEFVVQKILEGWSPEQISGRMKFEGRESVSHESIYRYIWGIRSGALYKFLRRYRRHKKQGRQRVGYWNNQRIRRQLDERPRKANQRKEVGHWERDLMEGSRGSASVLTCVDRKSRYIQLRKVKTKNSSEVNMATESIMKKVEVKSITNDNGREFGCFEKLEKRLGVKIYFCRPYSSWERGSVENVNGLLRQYLPKGKDLSKLTEEDLRYLEALLNNRPRKIHNFKTAHEIYFSKNLKLIKNWNKYKVDATQRHFSEVKSYLNK